MGNTFSVKQSLENHADWWSSLKHGGLLIAPSKLEEFFVSQQLPPLSRYFEDKLRQDITRLQAGDDKYLGKFLDTVLEDVLQLSRDFWQKGSSVARDWSRQGMTREQIKPRRVWQDDRGAVLPVFVADAKTTGGKVARLGIGRGKRAVSRVLEWLRKTDLKIALITNGYQWRLIHAGADYDAWCEWDIDLWFEEGHPSEQVTALRLLLGVESVRPESSDVPSPLIAAIQASRQGQAELSDVLGERVRKAVELLIRESAPSLDAAEGEPFGNGDIYIAANRIMMRCVVILFAEARDLLPRENPIYHDSYGIQGLREQLDRMAGGRASERLRHSYGAWPRLLALFRLVYEGSGHAALPVPRYGGGLFTPGKAESDDPVLRALAALESPDHPPSDASIYKILELLCRSKVKVRQGRRSTWVEAPVDFSDLSSEYIGILYEGLLDFELRRADENNPMIFLNLGDQPALPLTRLEGMEDKALATLVEKLKQKSKPSSGDEDEDEESEDEDATDTDEGGDDETEDKASDDEDDNGDLVEDLRQRARGWAIKAVKAGKLVKKPRSKKADKMAEYEQQVGKMADRLIARIVLPGEWFLVRWGGTRKGSGTFYTRPQLAVPTVQRTLLPLAYDPPLNEAGEPDEMAPMAKWSPKSPKEILGLKVCDPACGSASFLIASLRFLVEALWSSLFEHGWLLEEKDEIRAGIPVNAQPAWFVECVKDLPLTVEDAEAYSKPRLKRYMVERCIYGVDLNPLGVELGRLALWVETMDRSLPFGFLDHKVKCGNSLVGCWFDYFRDYPALAWEREGGDKNHNRGTHYKKEAWTKAIKEVRSQTVKKALRNWIEGKRSIFKDLEGKTPETIHNEAFQVISEIHNLELHQTEKRMQVYTTKMVDNASFQALKSAFNQWCAIWFWPADNLELAPLPESLETPSNQTKELINQLTKKYQFFHWELEFPDVFIGPNSGFNAVVGNPPWENLQPNPAEFFSNIDPLFRTYGRIESLARMEELFQQVNGLEREYLLYCSQFKGYSNWVKNAFSPFGDEASGGKKFPLGSKSDNLHTAWAEQRSKYKNFSDSRHPYQFQGGGRVFTYKLFLELAHTLLKHNGRFSLIVPSGIYSDKGTTELRDLFLSHCHWTHLYVFQNERFVFRSIHHSFKMAVVSVAKGGISNSILTRFRLGPGGSPEGYELEADITEDSHYLSMLSKQIIEFSPITKALLEIQSERDLYILVKIYSKSVRLGDPSHEGWQFRYALEFMMNTDAKLFPSRSKWEAKGYKPDEYGHWLKCNWHSHIGQLDNKIREPDLVLSADHTQGIYVGDVTDIALPFYQGTMIHQFDFSYKGWESGTGLRAIWKDIPIHDKGIEPQFLISLDDYQNNEKGIRGLKIVFRDIARSTDERTFIAALLPDLACGNVLGVLGSDVRHSWVLLACLNSYVFDWSVRQRIGGTHLNLFIVQELPLLLRQKIESIPVLLNLVARLCFISNKFADIWLEVIQQQNIQIKGSNWKKLWAITHHERLRIRCILDAVVAKLYGIDYSDFTLILQGCDHPSNQVCDSNFSRNLETKGFWRVDKEKDPELRRTVLSLIAFHDLKRLGLDTFLNLNDGEGWMLPETLRLADYGLGHDDRAKEPQPVAARLGPRFLPWQLEGTPEESWAECERHAENLRQLLGTPTPQPPTPAANDSPPAAPPPPPPKKNDQLTLIPPDENQLTLF